MSTYKLYLLLTVCVSAYAQQGQVAITIDDLPLVTYYRHDSAFKRVTTHKLLSVLAKEQVPAIGFVNEDKLYTQGTLDQAQVALLHHWLKQGFNLGNHTYAHLDYNKVSYEEYTHDIVKGERITAPLVKQYGKTLRYFRHPYLHTGKSQGAHDSLEVYLKSLKYTTAPVTIDNDEYLFAKAYEGAMRDGDSTLLLQIGRDYVSYMVEKLMFYHNMSLKLFGRPIKQVLLIHANVLNADYLQKLISAYKAKEYSFIRLDKALKDKAYKSPITRFGPRGISWLDRWALSQGKTADFFKEDPKAPDYIVVLAK